MHLVDYAFLEAFCYICYVYFFFALKKKGYTVFTSIKSLILGSDTPYSIRHHKKDHRDLKINSSKSPGPWWHINGVPYAKLKNHNCVHRCMKRNVFCCRMKKKNTLGGHERARWLLFEERLVWTPFLLVCHTWKLLNGAMTAFIHYH